MTPTDPLKEALAWADAQKIAPGATVDYADRLVIVLAAAVRSRDARIAEFDKTIRADLCEVCGEKVI